jgi:protein-S-isoprenylcysteine O-methyltransferase Ste14
MGLKRELEVTGNWLFRYRSFVPLVLLLPFLVKMRSYHFPYNNHELHEIMHLVCIAVTFSGLAIRIFVAGFAPDGTSGRNTKAQAAQRLNTTGMYSIVRHPLYLGNFLMWGGIPLFRLDPWLLLVFCLVFWLYYERIMYAEEQYLLARFGDEYTRWAARTPSFLPRLSNWISADRSFSLRRALRQEYTSLFLAMQAMVAVELLEHWAIDHRFIFEWEWVVFSLAGTTTYLILRIMKKNSHFLSTADT